MGKEIAVDLARRGARVIIACRNIKKAEEAVKEIQRRSGSSNVVYKHLELSDQGSVRRFAEEFIREEPRLDYLINNAGESLSISVVKDSSVWKKVGKQFVRNVDFTILLQLLSFVLTGLFSVLH